MTTEDVKECFECYGCGHICLECEEPINACKCDLDVGFMRQCGYCEGDGYVPRERAEA